MTELLSRHQIYHHGPHREKYLAGKRDYRRSEKGKEIYESYKDRRNALKRFYRHQDKIRRALQNGFLPEELAIDYKVPLDRVIKFKQDENL